MIKKIADRIRKYRALNYNLGYPISLGTYLKALISKQQEPERKFVIYGSGPFG